MGCCQNSEEVVRQLKKFRTPEYLQYEKECEEKRELLKKKLGNHWYYNLVLSNRFLVTDYEVDQMLKEDDL